MQPLGFSLHNNMKEGVQHEERHAGDLSTLRSSGDKNVHFVLSVALDERPGSYNLKGSKRENMKIEAAGCRF